jgi:phosphoglycolate phosphatase
MRSRRRTVHAIVLDLDNTLYDWVGYFVPAVRAMLAEAARQLSTDPRSLREDLRRVHVRHGNTEHPFALLETAAVRRRLAGLTARERHQALRPAFDAFNAARASQLRLYPAVADTLDSIRAAGCRLVGHTEATEVNIAARARALGLHTRLEAIYASEFTGPPHPLGAGRQRGGEPVPVVALRNGARKPDPELARRILRQVGVPAEHSLYVGDSVAKDIAMARGAGMMTAWARYGTRHDAALWTELVELSHWDPATVAAAAAASPLDEPDVVLDSFDQLLEHFEFGAPAPPHPGTRSEPTGRSR